MDKELQYSARIENLEHELSDYKAFAKEDTHTIEDLRKEIIQLRQLLADYANGYYDTETIRKFLNNENKRS